MKKKSSIIARIGVLALVLTLVTTTMTSGTLAKYVTMTSQQAKAIVANWNPTAAIKNKAGTALTTGTAVSFRDLVTMTDASGVVASKIAPGMKGEFSVEVNAKNSEVDLDYEVYVFKASDSNANIQNMKFYEVMDSGAAGTSVSPAAETTENLNAMLGDSPTKAWDSTYVPVKKGTINTAATQKTAQVKIGWEWAYETGTTADDKLQNDAFDTAAGSEAAVNGANTELYYIVVRMVQKKLATTSTITA